MKCEYCLRSQASAGWCTYCGRRVQFWECEYERVMGHGFGV